MGAIAATALLQISNAKALEKLDAGIYSIYFNLRIPLATVFGVAFLSERVIPLQIAGGMLIFGAIFFLRQHGNRLITAGVHWGMTAALSLSLLSLCEKGRPRGGEQRGRHLPPLPLTGQRRCLTPPAFERLK